MPGELVSDVDTALHAWPQDPGPTLFVLFVERNTDDVAAYLHWLCPALEFDFDRDPLAMGGDIAYVHVPAAPPDLAARLAATACNGAIADFTLIGKNAGRGRRSPAHRGAVHRSQPSGRTRSCSRCRA